MDLRDFDIVTELHRHPFASYEAIGRSIGTTGAAVKIRIGNMEARRLLLPFQVVPRASILRRFGKLFIWNGLESEPSFRKCLDREDVVLVWRAAQGLFAINLYSVTGELDCPAGLVKLLGRAPDQCVLMDSPHEAGQPDSVLSPLDWRVLDVLLENPRIPLVELAKRTGLTPRTVRKRRDALVSSRRLDVTPTLDTTREPGLIVFAAYVRLETQAAVPALQPDNLTLVRTHHAPPAAVFSGHAENLAEFRNLERTLGSSPGVLGVDIIVPRGAAVASGRLREWVWVELARWDILRRATLPSRSNGR